MAVLLILCDADKDDRQTQLLKDAIQEFGEALPLSHSSHLIYSELSSDDIARRLKKKIGTNQAKSLMVITVPDPYTGPAPLQVKVWLEKIKRKVRKKCAAAAALNRPALAAGKKTPEQA